MNIVGYILYFLPLTAAFILGIIMLFILKRHSEMMDIYGEGVSAKKKIKEKLKNANAEAASIIKQAKREAKDEEIKIKAKYEQKYDEWLTNYKATTRRNLLLELDKEIKTKKSESLRSIAKLKEKKEQEIKEKAAKTLSSVLTNSLLKSLSRADQDKLVMDAFEKAKSQKMF